MKTLDPTRTDALTQRHGLPSAAGEAGARESVAGCPSPASPASPQAVSVRLQWQDPAAHWIVVHHRADSGARTRLSLRRLGFEVHWPRETHRIRGRDDTLRPFFPGYLFALPKRASASWHLISKATVPDLVQVCGVRERGKPVQPPRGFVLGLIKRAGGAIDGVIPTKEDELADVVTWDQGQQLRITEGPFEGLEAVLHEDRGEERVKVLLRMLGVERPVVVERSALVEASG